MSDARGSAPWIPCDVCGKLGWKMAAQPPKHVAFSFHDDRPGKPMVVTGAACDEHRAIVELRLREQRYPPSPRDRQ